MHDLTLQYKMLDVCICIHVLYVCMRVYSATEVVNQTFVSNIRTKTESLVDYLCCTVHVL